MVINWPSHTSILPSSQGTPALAVGGVLLLQGDHPVIALKRQRSEAGAGGGYRHECSIVLVKDQDVYWLAERGERQANRRQKLIAVSTVTP